MAINWIVRPPRWLRWLYGKQYHWSMQLAPQNTLYLTFDDGPHPAITPLVLDLLAQYGHKATFFCVGENALRYPALIERIHKQGHGIGGHTMHHLNGWHTPTDTYVKDALEAQAILQTPLFRPPYGRIKQRQWKQLHKQMPNTRVILWSILTEDYRRDRTPENCFDNVKHNANTGSIIVFHDSVKAKENCIQALALTLQWMKAEGWRSDKLT